MSPIINRNYFRNAFLRSIEVVPKINRWFLFKLPIIINYQMDQMDRHYYLLLDDRRRGKDNLLSLMLIDSLLDSSFECNTFSDLLHF